MDLVAMLEQRNSTDICMLNGPTPKVHDLVFLS